METKIPLAFAAGLLSFVTPCVLPLVPGYLSAVSGTQVGMGGRRVAVASIPFIAGFTAVFVALGAAAGAAGGLFNDARLLRMVAGLIVVIFGFAFMGLLPFPWLDRMAAPELVEGARQHGSTLGHYGITGFPETWFVDRSGRLVGKHVSGPVSDAELERYVQLALQS